MKTLRYIFSRVFAIATLFFVTLSFSACNGVIEKDDVNSKVDKEKVEPVSSAPSVTVGAENISAVSVVLKGKANPTDPYDMKLGFQYKKAGDQLVDPSDVFATCYDPEKYTYSVSITGLEPGVEYSFRSFTIQNKQEPQFGETMTFTTKEITSMFCTQDASDITNVGATLNGKLDLTDVQCKDQENGLEYGFYWGVSESELSNYVKGGAIAENIYSANLTNLSPVTQHWYKAYLKVDGQEFYGDVKIFITDVMPVTEVLLDQSSVVCHTIDSVFTLTATVKPDDATNKNVSWTSSDDAVATVENGKVTAKGNGNATITVITEDQGKKATCTITVAQYVTGITLNKTSLVLVEGKSETLTVTSVNPDNANDKTLTWSSSNTSVATVDKTGKVTAVSKGTATITVTAKDGSGTKATCSVTVIRPVTSITLDKTSLAIYNGKTKWLTATVSPSTASNTGVTWSSSNTSVATVSSSGVVTGVARGTATITVASTDGSGKSASCQVEVKQYVTSITLDKTSLVLLEGKSETLAVTSVNPDNANDKTYTWSSSNTSVATVDQTGKVTAIAKGRATISATAKDGSGVYASCSLKVLPPCPSGAVDLGLSVYWATSNLSESGLCAAPEDYGDYYAWGETSPYYESGYAQSKSPVWKKGKSEGYDWPSYKWCNGSYNSLTKYNFKSLYGNVDYNSTLDADDDVAHVKLGGSWRMPTEVEWAELQNTNNCTWTWTMQNGINGYKVTSKKSGYTDKSIFLPAAGLRYDTFLGGVGSSGYYWSSWLYTVYPHDAYNVYFHSDSVFEYRNYFRYYGQSVRPIVQTE